MAGRLSQCAALARRFAYNLPEAAAPAAQVEQAVAEATILLALVLPDAALGPLCRVYETTVTHGARGFAVPADFLRDRALFFTPDGSTTPRQAQRWSIGRLGELSENPARQPSAAQPFYAVWGDTIELYVGADSSEGSVKLYYVARPDWPLDADPPVPPEFDVALVDYAAALLYQARLDAPAAEVAWQKFGVLLRQAAMRYGGTWFEGILGDAERSVG